MPKSLKPLTLASLVLAFSAFQFGCQTTGGGSFQQVAGNENGSAPVNEKEVSEYKREVLKCYKTGGTRVIKVEGTLRCFN